MDVDSRAEYPASALSNFAAYSFNLDGVDCASMEGFLQGLKFKDPEKQVHACSLSGRRAKAYGAFRNAAWKKEQVLWWKGHSYDRQGEEYQELLDRAYVALLQTSPDFRTALRATGTEVLTHSIGLSDPTETVLTEDEFCLRLTQLRERL